MQLIKYRDPQSKDYIWFWVAQNQQVSPAFDSEKEATDWLDSKVDEWDNWKANKDLV